MYESLHGNFEFEECPFNSHIKRQDLHGIKGFVMPTKSFVKIGITKIFCYKTKCLVLSTKRLVAAAKFLVAATKKILVVPNFVAITKPFFPCDFGGESLDLISM